MPKTKSGSSRKLGRNKTKAAAYAGAARREKNKLKKLHKHLKKVGGADQTAQDALGRLKLWKATR